MESNQVEAWKRIKNAGTVSLVRGWLGIVLMAGWLIVGLLFIIMPFDIPADSGYPPLPSPIYGILIVIVSIIFLPFVVLDIIAGIKLRKPVPQPKNWLIYTLVVGVLGATTIQGIIQIIFSLQAYNMYHYIEAGAKAEPQAVPQVEHQSSDANKTST